MIANLIYNYEIRELIENIDLEAVYVGADARSTAVEWNQFLQSVGSKRPSTPNPILQLILDMYTQAESLQTKL
jgi:hypothetical protein